MDGDRRKDSRMDGKHSITEGSRIRVIQNCMGDLIIGTEKEKVAVGREIAFRIKV